MTYTKINPQTCRFHRTIQILDWTSYKGETMWRTIDLDPRTHCSLSVSSISLPLPKCMRKCGICERRRRRKDRLNTPLSALIRPENEKCRFPVFLNVDYIVRAYRGKQGRSISCWSPGSIRPQHIPSYFRMSFFNITQGIREGTL